MPFWLVGPYRTRLSLHGAGNLTALGCCPWARSKTQFAGHNSGNEEEHWETVLTELLSPNAQRYNSASVASNRHQCVYTSNVRSR